MTTAQYLHRPVVRRLLTAPRLLLDRTDTIATPAPRTRRRRRSPFMAATQATTEPEIMVWTMDAAELRRGVEAAGF